MSALATRAFDALLRRRTWVVLSLALGALAGLLGISQLPIDMSFRPTFIGDARELERTREHEQVFGQVGFRDLVALVDVGNASDPKALGQVAQLSERLRALPDVIGIRDPLHFPFFDGQGLRAQGVAGALPPGTSLDSAPGRALIASLLSSPSARRVIVGDGDRRLAVTATLDLPNEAFAERRRAVSAFRDRVSRWSHETGYATQVTGYPEVEQVYAQEVLAGVFRSIAVLLLIMLGILFLYFRRWSDVLTCLLGVTLSVPLVLGAMAALGQPFSIVNSQVLTLVLIVGIGQALHHQEEYRRRREAGREHAAANREAFAILAWPSFMTGFATFTGFAALTSADMRAVWSFGLSTALGVAIVYGVNWLVVPLAIRHFYRNTPSRDFGSEQRGWTLAIVRRVAELVQRSPRGVVLGFVVVSALLAVFGLSGLSVDQRVNEELPAGHSAVLAEQTYEREFAGFLGPELAIRAARPGAWLSEAELSAFVNRLCDMPEVRFVASALDFSPQPEASDHAGKACQRTVGPFSAALSARSGAAGPELARLAGPVLARDATRTAIVVRVADIGTAHSLPFVERVRQAARETMPHAVVEPVGQWWLAQQGMNRLSFDVMFSAITALLVILPIMWFAIRDRDLFLAAIPATILPVFATLGFMGLLHITVRIGTAMILAIALGLAADDTIHLSVRIRDRRRAGCDAASAVSATLLRTGRPCSFSSYVLIGGFASMLASSLLALQAMGMIAMFSMAFALAADVILGPALYLLLANRRATACAEPKTLAELLIDTVAKHPERPALSYRVPDGAFRTLSWHELAHLVRGVAAELDRCLRGETVVAVLADTNARYPALELALALTGRTLQPLYVSASDDELRSALAQSGARVLVAGPEEAARARRATLCRTVLELNVLVPLLGVDSGAPALPPEVEPFDTRALSACLRALLPRDPETPVLYLQSTGTTGPARVIVISERALLSAARSAAREASHAFPRFLSFLPTAHISERLLTLYVSLISAGHTYYGGGQATLAQDLPACLPTALLTPPQLLEALRARAAESARGTALGRASFSAVARSARALLHSGVAGGAPRGLAARLFGWQLRRRAGLQRVRDFLAGAAPVSAELHAWCEAAGLPLRIVYGQTELTGATTIGPRVGARFGAVGLPVLGVELRLVNDELLVRSDARFERYLGDPTATARALEHDWLHTGDRACFADSGELVLLGRVQALLRASDGSTVDTAALSVELGTRAPGATCVFEGTAEGAALYVSFTHHQTTGPAQVLLDSDPRWSVFGELLRELDRHRLVQGLALFEGAFRESSGEVGPTGKPRARRIHALHSHQLRPFAPAAQKAISHVATHPARLTAHPRNRLLD